MHKFLRKQKTLFKIFSNEIISEDEIRNSNFFFLIGYDNRCETPKLDDIFFVSQQFCLLLVDYVVIRGLESGDFKIRYEKVNELIIMLHGIKIWFRVKFF